MEKEKEKEKEESEDCSEDDSEDDFPVFEGCVKNISIEIYISFDIYIVANPVDV